jgi:hypothetical protein
LSSLTTGEFFLKVEKKRTKEVDEGGKIHIGNCVLSGESCAVNILMFFKLNWTLAIRIPYIVIISRNCACNAAIISF